MRIDTQVANLTLQEMFGQSNSSRRAYSQSHIANQLKAQPTNRLVMQPKIFASILSEYNFFLHLSIQVVHILVIMSPICFLNYFLYLSESVSISPPYALQIVTTMSHTTSYKV